MHPAITLSSYLMSQVQYSLGGLFKECLSRRADKMLINLVAAAQHESLCLGYIGHRQAVGPLTNIFSPADDLGYLHEVQNLLHALLLCVASGSLV